MPLVQRAHHHLHFETLGDPRNPPLLLIMGLALPPRPWDRLPGKGQEKTRGGPSKGARRAERPALRYGVAKVRAIARHHTLPRLSQIRAPTLVLTGGADRLVPPENSAILARNIPGARLLVL